ncbi:Zinc finger CCCH domain-containing protein [Cyphellophora attinorum]|uniref:Zinc finger CCCH domain-containing protein n=1 Tax=Cyphellophora attinorum TaxID=1664694 RepID=A0A0N0NHS8_9EURO|nr:Zinc finger CCCH domain-containing protein [Phialophora attinorum]KPI34619.1 Zinc finger CCCH domain-containing protein [Phialophora attinorum]
MANDDETIQLLRNAAADRKKHLRPDQWLQPIRTDESDLITPREDSECSSSISPGSTIPTIEKPKKLCRNYCLRGFCNKFPCEYRHDASKTALCSAAAMGLRCSVTLSPMKQCLLQHTPTPHNLYHCVFFLQGLCVNLDCSFLHRPVDADALACHEFATIGYCEAGSSCKEVHVQPCSSASTDDCGHWTCKLVRPRPQKKKPTDTIGKDSEPERLLGGGKSSMTTDRFVKALAEEDFVGPVKVQTGQALAEDAFAPNQDSILFE